MLSPPGLPMARQCGDIAMQGELSKQVKSLELFSSEVTDRLDRFSALVCSIPERTMFDDNV